VLRTGLDSGWIWDVGWKVGENWKMAMDEDFAAMNSVLRGIN